VFAEVKNTGTGNNARPLPPVPCSLCVVLAIERWVRSVELNTLGGVLVGKNATRAKQYGAFTVSDYDSIHTVSLPVIHHEQSRSDKACS